MSINILQTFYNRMMPLFTPQAERILDSVQPTALQDLAFRYTFSVDAMTKISHIIEDAVIQTPRTAVLHASFQYLSRITPQQARYRQVAQAAEGLWLYYAADADPAQADTLLKMPRVFSIDTADTPLVNYWFVVAYGGGVHMTLLAQEILSLSGHERYYEGFYTFEADAAYQILHILHQIYPAKVPLPLPPDLEHYR
ncbi:MAG TPA: DICT sensory domain-containing protein [Chloroflexota bacterium]|nr:DICT sensory domain-containing protein [Chloroflexota bacterium]